eukprot:CAMPEP_0171291846 /NCGR_PEP_ID=MMETSP0790-20130122/71857_1 /TAXON_ID=2925 /ORGANISM="Alexandrium catenella, Strain OF101" /LENGTH=153 /DNA_ID=CAMNT_0011761571 /DNA_START=66 /DNA_END=523 /DNA_ORIENTATION=+
MIDGTYSQKYDTKISTTKQGGMSWLFGGAPKSEAEIRDERYAGFVISLNKVLTDWRSNNLSASEALTHADHYMENIMAIGKVDGERAQTILQSRGIDDLRRVALQKDFQDLKKPVQRQEEEEDMLLLTKALASPIIIRATALRAEPLAPVADA